ncbi:hypothetical protein PRVXT_001679 [Proteinivorax tanatarense]|uniref:Uncharacterized protein n=1 Tax=Proteinivorax tanatarense TaxID=1260629 RepID=A0AAU7VI50_9FIRM
MLNKITRRAKLVVIPTIIFLVTFVFLEDYNVQVLGDDLIDRNQKPNRPYYYYLQVFNVENKPLLIINTNNNEHLIYLGPYKNLTHLNLSLEDFLTVYMEDFYGDGEENLLSKGSHFSLSENSYLDIIDSGVIMLKINRLNFLIVEEKGNLEKLDMYHDFQFVISNDITIYTKVKKEFSLENFFYIGSLDKKSSFAKEDLIPISKKNYINIISDGSTLEIFQKNIK